MVKFLFLLFLIPAFAFPNAQESRDASVLSELEANAMTFFQVVIGEKDAESLSGIEMSDAMQTWVQGSGAKRIPKDLERMFGGIGSWRKNEHIEHSGNLRSVELFYSGITQAFKIRVTFAGKQISGFHYLPWTDEQNQYGTPIRLETPAGTIYGSLVEPEQAQTEAVPMILIVAGSGPTDRNGNQSPALVCNTYVMLAQALQQHGVASMRYDKRGVGASAKAGADESQLHFEDYIDDVCLWLDILSREKRYSKIIVAGHSEGSLIGMTACARSGYASGFISLCGAGRSIDEVILEQLKRQSRSLHDSMVSILNELKQGKTVENVPPELTALVRPSLQPYMISWLKYDPRDEIKKLTIPAMIVQGTTDIQISLADADFLAEANPKAQKMIIKNMDHLLKTNSTTLRLLQLMNYTHPNIPLHEELVPGIIHFIFGMAP
ncbi:MAG: lysophospholipase [Planctomycetaceae bacterium]|nr:lysophospholipase [Planctomycetaceae bacterium]